MGFGTLIQLALALMKFVNLVLNKIDQSHWEASGYQKAMADELALANKSIGLAEQAVADAKKMTPEERRKELGGDV